MTSRYSWSFTEPGARLERVPHAGREAASEEVVVEVAGCGVCHTDLGFLDGGVKTRAPLPLVLGHEISGTVVEVGPGADAWLGTPVLVAAVIPCGRCDLCRAGRGNMCSRQLMPGNDMDGGFATHVTVPIRGLTAVGDLPEGHELADMAVIADAVTTPLQAVWRAGVVPGDLVVVVGTGGVGTYAVQVAAAKGATVVAVDIDDARLQPLLAHGASATVNSRGLSARDVRDRVREIAGEAGAPPGWKILECSGTVPGQETAFGLLGPTATLAVVGFTRDMVSIRLSNLMAFDATAFGSWGCPPERYPEAVQLVASGKVTLTPFTRKVPMDDIVEVLEDAHHGHDPRRTILIP